MTTPKSLIIGMIGLDTSHCTAFTKLLNEQDNEFHVRGGKVTYAFPGGSPDFELSYSRLERFTSAIRDEYGVQLLDSPEAVAEHSDAVLLTSVDGRVHLEQFRRIAPFGKPVFIDKPFAVSTSDAKEMLRLAAEHNVPLMSASSLRYEQGLVNALSEGTDDIIGADCYGPAELQSTQPGLFWYGIHAAEMLYRILGQGCVQVTASTSEFHELVVGVWQDGRMGTIRGNRQGNKSFGAVIHRANKTEFVDGDKHPKPKYAGLVEAAVAMFQSGTPSIAPQETIEIIRFLEAANESRATGKTVRL
ncbi:gfo/Idh/MocA family oxidoreductase [Paenibacillus sp. 5J-6]|uniref:Gfo/Idh/MocA family oxidoreductase n=1 Tax=Paenibacillus silvestris TaxID=2606219 RepID=A0A6L8V937_9BACL|nr:Gfo/Idh/MocA family oxidoreductase [Paenibacillus silvestris]MZQ86858.1 gfo/Idh/MocA family oxidoreductase [Paenibacillus silvestris]